MLGLHSMMRMFIGATILTSIAIVIMERHFVHITVEFYNSKNYSTVAGSLAMRLKRISYSGNRRVLNVTVCNVQIRDGMDLMSMEKISLINKFKNPCFYQRRHLHCLPYVYLVGVAKCGTTDLFKRITLHPDFVAPATKEPNWLSAGRFWRNESFRYYTSAFFSPLSKMLSSGRSTEMITGEASINTLEGGHFWPYLGLNIGHDEPVENNPEYIYHLNNQSRILINVRNPVDRLWSEYLAFSTSSNKSAEKFHKIVVKEIRLYNQCLQTRTLRSCMYDRQLAQLSTTQNSRRKSEEKICNFNPTDIVMLRRGVYHVFIKDYLKVFTRDHVHIQRLEDISDDPEGTLIQTYKFLDLKIPTRRRMRKIMQLGIRNKRKSADLGRKGMLDATRDILHEFYKPYNKQLSILLNDSKYNYGPRG